MQRSLFLLPFLMVLGCSGDDKDSAGTDDTGTTDDSCTVTVASTTPTSNATDAYYRGDIEFHLTAADTTATITTDIPGTQEVSEDGKTVYWRISAPLTASTAYTATLTYCGGEVPLSFTTSDLGTPVTDTAGLVGRTYSLALSDARIVEPPNIGSLLSSVLTVPILVSPTSVSDSEIEMIGAVGVEGSNPPAQDVCEASIPFPPATFENSSYVQIGPQDTSISVAGASLPINGLYIAGTFAEDGSYFGGGRLEGSLDARDIAVALADTLSGQTADDLCALVASVGATCGTCPDGQNYCLAIVADSIIAEDLGSDPLVEITDPTCE